MKIKEDEIRPKKIFKKFLQTSKKDILIFKNKKNWKAIQCIACNYSSKFVFSKNNFSFRECLKCSSLFVSPRPDKKYFELFYSNSKTSKYLNYFYKATEESRVKKLWKPKIKKILNLTDIKKIKKKYFVDIGGASGLFAREMFKQSKSKTFIIEPSPELFMLAKKRGFEGVNKKLENVKKSDLPNVEKIFTSFELVEHLHDPKVFFNKVYQLMKKGDFFIFTTLSGLGFDILALQENSNSVFPPHHINFFNPYSIKILLKKIGFTKINITTPGVLDIEIVKKNIHLSKNTVLQKIVERSLLDDETMQKKISELNLSSHMMSVCAK